SLSAGFSGRHATANSVLITAKRPIDRRINLVIRLLFTMSYGFLVNKPPALEKSVDISKIQSIGRLTHHLHRGPVPDVQRASCTHSYGAVDACALIYHDRSRVNVAVDDRSTLHLDALGRNHRSVDGSCENHFRRLHVSMNDALAADNHLSWAGDG